MREVTVRCWILANKTLRAKVREDRDKKLLVSMKLTRISQVDTNIRPGLSSLLASMVIHIAQP